MWGKWVTEIKCFDQDQRSGVGEDENQLRIKKNKKREITLGRVEWAQGDMVAAVGTVRCGCKSSIPQKPECFRSHSEGPMTETQWELGVNNYPTWEAIAACTSPGLTCKNSDGLNPCLHPHWPKHKVFGRFGGLHSSGALPALPSTRMCIRSSLYPSRQLHDSFPYSGHHKCWVLQEIPISSPPEILHSLAQRSQHAASAYLWWGIAVVLRAALEKSWSLLASSLTHQVFNTFLTSVSSQNLEVRGGF